MVLLLTCPAKQNYRENRIKVEAYNVNLPKPYILDTLALPEVANNIADLEKVLSEGSRPSFRTRPRRLRHMHTSPFLKSSHMLSGLFSQWASTKSLGILCPVTSHQANSNLAAVPGSSWWESCFWQKLLPDGARCFRPRLPSPQTRPEITSVPRAPSPRDAGAKNHHGELCMFWLNAIFFPVSEWMLLGLMTLSVSYSWHELLPEKYNMTLCVGNISINWIVASRPWKNVWRGLLFLG